MQSMRSHDQYNTTIYGMDDRYRGVRGQRDVLFVNEADIVRLGFQPGQKVDIVSLWGDEHVRRVQGFTCWRSTFLPGRRRPITPR
jgi:anaerobic selenocysteine-containing dehydrogenase